MELMRDGGNYYGYDGSVLRGTLRFRDGHGLGAQEAHKKPAGIEGN